jgi:all-trans-retinol 13,14-reductase
MAGHTQQQFDAIVIGSGIGGLTAAAALTRSGRKVAVLERHAQLGGLSQSFERQGWRFDVGVHSIGGAGSVDGRPGALRKMLDALTPDGLPMASTGPVTDTIRLPGFSFDVRHPARQFADDLRARFPEEGDGITRYFAALTEARKALEAVFAAHSMPGLVSRGMLWVKSDEIERWVGRTTAEVMDELINEPRLKALLTAQWGDYGGQPTEASFAIHATVMASYLDGAYYPEGGGASFAREFARGVSAGGGELRTGAEVQAILMERERVTGVRLADGSVIGSECVVSDAGARNTLRLLPSEDVPYEWAADALMIEPSVGYIGLYLGLEGDVEAAGASRANVWVHEDWNINRLWRDPASEPDAPAMFVSFPSLKDPRHDAGPARKHTCEIVTLVDADAFKQWERSGAAHSRDAGYQAYKKRIEQQLLAQFTRHFPALAPMVKFVTSSTPLSVAAYTGAEHGAMYGLAVSPQRFLSEALRPRTPVHGLYLAGQDACCPGVTGALMGGLMAAIAVDPRLLGLLR